MRTAGTQLYFIDPVGCVVTEVGCPTSITGLDSTIDQLETTCLADTARTYEAGLATPGTASFTLSFEPGDPSHIRLNELKKAGDTIQWAIGLPDGTVDPTGAAATSGGGCEFDTFPTSRSFIQFEGFVNSYSFDFGLNAVIAATVGIQVSGDPNIYPKTP